MSFNKKDLEETQLIRKNISNIKNKIDESIIWRGPKKNSMIRRFLKEVEYL